MSIGPYKNAKSMNNSKINPDGLNPQMIESTFTDTATLVKNHPNQERYADFDTSYRNPLSLSVKNQNLDFFGKRPYSSNIAVKHHDQIQDHHGHVKIQNYSSLNKTVSTYASQPNNQLRNASAVEYGHTNRKNRRSRTNSARKIRTSVNESRTPLKYSQEIHKGQPTLVSERVFPPIVVSQSEIVRVIPYKPITPDSIRNASNLRHIEHAPQIDYNIPSNFFRQSKNKNSTHENQMTYSSVLSDRKSTTRNEKTIKFADDTKDTDKNDVKIREINRERPKEAQQVRHESLINDQTETLANTIKLLASENERQTLKLNLVNGNDGLLSEKNNQIARLEYDLKSQLDTNDLLRQDNERIKKQSHSQKAENINCVTDSKNQVVLNEALRSQIETLEFLNSQSKQDDDKRFDDMQTRIASDMNSKLKLIQNEHGKLVETLNARDCQIDDLQKEAIQLQQRINENDTNHMKDTLYWSDSMRNKEQVISEQSKHFSDLKFKLQDMDCKTKTYDQIIRELKDQQLLSEEKYNQSLDTVKNKELTIRHLEQDYERLTECNECYGSDVDTLNEMVNQNRTTIDSYYATINEKNDYITEIEKDLYEANDVICNNSVEFSKLEVELQEIINKFKDSEANYESLKSENKQLKLGLDGKIKLLEADEKINKDLNDDLAKINGDNFGLNDEVKQQQNENQKYMELIDSLNSENEVHRNYLDQSEIDFSNLNLIIGENNKQIEELNDTVQRFSSEIESVNKHNANLLEDNAILEQNNETNCKEVSRLGNLVDDLQRNMNNLQEDYEMLKSESATKANDQDRLVYDLQKNLDNHVKDSEMKDQMNENLKSKLERVMQDFSLKNEENLQLKKQGHNNESEMRHLQDQMYDLTKENSNVAYKKDELARDLKKKESDLTEIDSKVFLLNKEVDQKQQENMQLSKSVSDLDKKLQDHDQTAKRDYQLLENKYCNEIEACNQLNEKLDESISEVLALKEKYYQLEKDNYNNIDKLKLNMNEKDRLLMDLETKNYDLKKKDREIDQLEKAQREHKNENYIISSKVKTLENEYNSEKNDQNNLRSSYKQQELDYSAALDTIRCQKFEVDKLKTDLVGYNSVRSEKDKLSENHLIIDREYVSLKLEMDTIKPKFFENEKKLNNKDEELLEKDSTITDLRIKLDQYQHNLKNLQQNLGQSQNEEESLRETLVKYQSDSSTCLTKIENLEDKVTRLNNEYESLRQNYNCLLTDFENSEEDCKKLDTKNYELENEISSLLEENNTLRKSQTRVEIELRGFKDDIVYESSQKEELEQKYDRAIDDLNKAQTDLVEFESKLNRTERQLDAASKSPIRDYELREINDKLKELSLMNDGYRAQLDEFVNEVEMLTCEITQLNQGIIDKELIICTASDQNNNLIVELESVTILHKDLKISYENLLNTTRDVQEENCGWTDCYEELKAENCRLIDSVEDYRRDIERNCKYASELKVCNEKLVVESNDVKIQNEKKNTNLIESLEKEVEHLRNSLEYKSAEAQDLRQQVLEKDKELNSRNQENRNIFAESDKLQRVHDRVTADLDKCTEEMKGKELNMFKLAETVKDKQSDIDAYNKAIIDLEVNVSNLKEIIRQKDLENERQMINNTDLKNEIANQNVNLAHNVSEQDSLKRKNKELTNDTDKLAQEISRMKKQLREKNEEINKGQIYKNEVSNSIRENQGRILTTEREKEQLKKDKSDLKDEVKHLKQIKKDKENENRKLRDDFKHTAQDSAKLKFDLNDAQAKLSARSEVNKPENNTYSVTRSKIMHSEHSQRYDRHCSREVQNSLKDAEKKIWGLEDKIVHLNHTVDLKRNEIAVLKEDIKKKQEIINQQETVNHQNILELDKLKDQIYAGKKALRNLRDNRDGLEDSVKNDWTRMGDIENSIKKDANSKIKFLTEASKELIDYLKHSDQYASQYSGRNSSRSSLNRHNREPSLDESLKLIHDQKMRITDLEIEITKKSMDLNSAKDQLNSLTKPE